MPPRAPRPVVIVLGIALLCCIWGTTYFVIRTGLEDLTPLHAAAWRFSIAALVFTVLAPMIHAREGGEPPAPWLSLVMGIAVAGIPYGIVYWSELRVPSGLTSVLWGTFPMMMAAGGHFALEGERVTPLGILGLSLGFGGVVALFFTDLRALGPDVVSAGAVLLLSPFVATFGQITVKRHGAGTSSALLNRNGTYIGAAVLWAGAVLFESDAVLTWTPAALFSVGYLAIVATVLAFGLYFWLLRYAPLGQMALIAYIVPALALFVGAVLGGEPVGASTLLGTGLIIAGVALVTRARARARVRSRA